MDSRTYYYARVSSKEQNLDRQIAAFVLAKFWQNFSKKFSNGIISRWKKKMWQFEQYKTV